MGDLLEPNARDSSERFQEAELCKMAQQLFSNNERDIQKACVRFRQWASREDDSLIGPIVDIGIVSRFIVLLKESRILETQENLVWILLNIAAGTTEQTKAIVDVGAVPILIKLLESDFKTLQDLAVRTLANIVGDCPSYRDVVLDHGIMEPLLRMLNQESTVNGAVLALRNLCRDISLRPDFEKVSKSLSTLSNLLFHTDIDLLRDVCWTICYLVKGYSDRIQQVIDAGVCKRLVQLMVHSAHSVSFAALVAVGNITIGDVDQTQVILNFLALPTLLYLLHSPTVSIRHHCCWIISNITAGNQAQIQKVIDANIVPVLINILGADTLKTRKEAAWALNNISSVGSFKQIEFIVKKGCISAFCNLLTVKDSTILNVILDSLNNILRSGDAEAKINGGFNPYATMVEECSGYTNMSSLENFKVCRLANDIIQTYRFCKQKEAGRASGDQQRLHNQITIKNEPND